MGVLQQRIHGMGEGVTIALDSIRANKVRAGLTILGIAVGVFVVVVISAAIHGINASVAKDFESTGPTTFFVSRFPITFEACDGTEDTCKWFRNPKLTLGDVATIEQLPSVRTAGARLDTSRPGAYKAKRVASVVVQHPMRVVVFADGSEHVRQYLQRPNHPRAKEVHTRQPRRDEQHTYDPAHGRCRL